MDFQITESAESGREERRGQLDLILEMLKQTSQPIKKTHILYIMKLNHYQLSHYLGVLIRLGMVEEISTPFTGYLTTEKGRMLLELFAMI